MRKYWLHVRSNIRKTKSATVTLLIMFIVSALLLNAGLLVTVNYGSFFDKLKEELESSDAYLLMSDALYTDEANRFIDTNEHIEKVQTHDVLLVDVKIGSKGEEKSFPIMFNNMDEQREISKWKFVGEHLPAGEMSVYVPDIFKVVSGYQLNDEIKLKYMDEAAGEEKVLVFTVKGYTEDVFFSSSDTGNISFFLPADTYKKVAGILQSPKYKAHVAFMELDDIKNAPKLENELRELLDLNSSSMMAPDVSKRLTMIDIELIGLSRCMMATMISVMMVVFALIIVAVCLLVVWFRIANSIEDDMMKLGSLKSIGYTSRQIILIIMLQFGLIAGIGSVAGIALSYPALPAVSAVYEQQSGLKWMQGFDGGVSLTALLIMLVVVAVVAFFAVRRVTKLSPINALRGEGAARKYKKNHVQLESTKGNLSFVLALKSVVQNWRQNTMIAVIVAAVTFTGAFGAIMLYNTTVNTKAFAEVPGMEICNVIAVLNPGMEHTDAVNTIKSMATVRKTQYLDEVKVKIDGGEATSFVMADYSTKETQLAYDGRYPKAKNEITLAGILAERLDKKVGDTVLVSYGDSTETFDVVGLSNGSAMGGQNVSILKEDFQRLNPEFRPQLLDIYLDKGTDAEEFIKKLESKLDKALLLRAVNFDKGMAEGMASYQNIVSAMGIVMFIITMLVVTLVLYFVIDSSIIRRKRELGIQKAIGYTTFQLMSQISINFAVPVILGSVIGSLLGAFYTNPLMSVTMKSAGVMKANFIVNPVWIVIFGVAIIVFSYALSLLITWRIRRISAYSLVTE